MDFLSEFTNILRKNKWTFPILLIGSGLFYLKTTGSRQSRIFPQYIDLTCIIERFILGQMMNLTLPCAAEVYGFKRQQLYELCRSEQIKHVRFGKSFMIPAYCIKEWIEMKAEQTTERREEILKNGGRLLR